MSAGEHHVSAGPCWKRRPSLLYHYSGALAGALSRRDEVLEHFIGLYRSAKLPGEPVVELQTPLIELIDDARDAPLHRALVLLCDVEEFLWVVREGRPVNTVAALERLDLESSVRATTLGLRSLAVRVRLSDESTATPPSGGAP